MGDVTYASNVTYAGDVTYRGDVTYAGDVAYVGDVTYAVMLHMRAFSCYCFSRTMELFCFVLFINN